MFPEYRELITKLKTSDRHFLHLFDKHNNLDQKIQRMEAHTERKAFAKGPDLRGP